MKAKIIGHATALLIGFILSMAISAAWFGGGAPEALPAWLVVPALMGAVFFWRSLALHFNAEALAKL